MTAATSMLFALTMLVAAVSAQRELQMPEQNKDQPKIAQCSCEQQEQWAFGLN
jgi:hypothetical protein